MQYTVSYITFPWKTKMADKDDVEVTYKIDHRVRNSIVNKRTILKDTFYAFLIGDETEDCCEIVGCIKCTNYEECDILEGSDKKPDWIKETNEICSIVPTGLRICGLCYVGENEEVLKQTSVEKVYSSVDVQNELITNNQLVWLFNKESEEKEKDTALLYNVQHKRLKESEVYFDDIGDAFLAKHLTCRLKHKFEIFVEEMKSADVCKTLSKKVTRVCNQLPTAIFHLPECRLLIGDDMPCDNNKTCKELLEEVVDNGPGFSLGKSFGNQRSKGGKKDVLNIHLVESLSTNDDSNEHNHVPVILSQKREASFINMVFVVDLLVMVALNTSISKLPFLFIRGIKDQLQSILCCIETYTKGSMLCVSKAYHFRTPQVPYFTTCMYPWRQINGENFDHSLFQNERSSLLKKLLLPQQRPTLHPNNKYVFHDDRLESSYLVNPHKGLTNPAGTGCHVAVVDGYYSYHHYMQDNFDDNKWGCAYRSLQTIISWFRHQGYTDQAIPGHRKIQEALVAVGDKEPSFIGSKKWIGSFEVSLCLEYFLEVTSKIMAVNNGAELQYKGRELIHHFQTQGTPVMIGGGVLAHTILGVSFNEKTGEIKFLILDPHYTGGENLKIVLDKGWCGWKNHLFWNQQAHYNLCMPQRPIKV